MNQTLSIKPQTLFGKFLTYLRRSIKRTGPKSPVTKHKAYWRGLPFEPSKIVQVKPKPGTAMAVWRGVPFDPALVEARPKAKSGQCAYWRGVKFDPSKKAD